MELREALTQISEIRLQLARTEVFRGLRALPVAMSGLLALAAAGFQAAWLPRPVEHLSAYLTLWIGAAVLSLKLSEVLTDVSSGETKVIQGDRKLADTWQGGD